MNLGTLAGLGTWRMERREVVMAEEEEEEHAEAEEQEERREGRKDMVEV